MSSIIGGIMGGIIGYFVSKILDMLNDHLFYLKWWLKRNKSSSKDYWIDSMKMINKNQTRRLNFGEKYFKK